MVSYGVGFYHFVILPSVFKFKKQIRAIERSSAQGAQEGQEGAGNGEGGEIDGKGGNGATNGTEGQKGRLAVHVSIFPTDSSRCVKSIFDVTKDSCTANGSIFPS